MLLSKFLVEAKQTMHIGKGKGAEPCRPNSKDFSFKKYNYYYYDSSIGNDDFIGQEVVWKNEKPYWAMNYHGKTICENSPSGLNNFLKKALSSVDETAPFRGPLKFEENEFVYECSWNGDVQAFNGEEHIKHNNEIVYTLQFHGGQLT